MWKEKMRKKPKLNIVGRDDDPASSPPPPFGKAEMRLWDAIMSENKLSETRDLETLAQICAARRSRRAMRCTDRARRSCDQNEE